MIKRRPFASALVAAFLAFCGVTSQATPARASEFKDVPTDHPAFASIQELDARGIVAGYVDGTFHPEKKLTRSEAVKMLMAPVMAGKNVSQHRSPPFSDVPEGSWYLLYAQEARKAGVLDGQSSKTVFQGERTVSKAEFMKMLLKAHAIDTGVFEDARDPFATDVQPDDWHYPFMAYGVASSMLARAPDGKLQPGQELTRADASVLLSSFLAYREGKRTLTLLLAVDHEMTVTLQSLEEKNAQAALFAAATALLQAKGARQSQPEALTNGVVHLAEAFLALAKGNGEGSVENYAASVAQAGKAWRGPDKGIKSSSALARIGQYAQDIAREITQRTRGREE